MYQLVKCFKLAISPHLAPIVYKMFLASLIYKDPTCIVYCTSFFKILYTPCSFCCLVSLTECVNTPRLMYYFA